MKITLLLFLISFSVLVILIARRFFQVKEREEDIERKIKEAEMKLEFEVPDLEEVKDFTKKKVRKYSYATLVSGIKLYIIGSNLLKKKVKKIYKKVEKKLLKKKIKTDNEIVRESSKFLKTIVEYKDKVKRIKDRIKEEEGIK
jgi:mannitol-specific phosphotransferase system IIBC component